MPNQSAFSWPSCERSDTHCHCSSSGRSVSSYRNTGCPSRYPMPWISSNQGEKRCSSEASGQNMPPSACCKKRCWQCSRANPVLPSWCGWPICQPLACCSICNCYTQFFKPAGRTFQWVLLATLQGHSAFQVVLQTGQHISQCFECSLLWQLGGVDHVRVNIVSTVLYQGGRAEFINKPEAAAHQRQGRRYVVQMVCITIRLAISGDCPLGQQQAVCRLAHDDNACLCQLVTGKHFCFGECGHLDRMALTKPQAGHQTFDVDHRVGQLQ